MGFEVAQKSLKSACWALMCSYGLGASDIGSTAGNVHKSGDTAFGMNASYVSRT